VKRAARQTKCCTVTTREVINGKSVVENLEFAEYDSKTRAATTHG
jgi:flagellum-specific peptidoglycan hydrolase FlgJ